MNASNNNQQKNYLTYRCNFKGCECSYVSNSGLWKHQKKDHPHWNNPTTGLKGKIVENGEIKKGGYVCNFCKKEKSTSESLRTHKYKCQKL